MNFNVYLDDDLVRRLDALAKRTGARRNTLIRQAVASWVKKARAEWPTSVLEWTGDAAIEPFEASRAELAEPPADPFGAPAARPARRAKRSRARSRR